MFGKHPCQSILSQTLQQAPKCILIWTAELSFSYLPKCLINPCFTEVESCGILKHFLNKLKKKIKQNINFFVSMQLFKDLFLIIFDL